jgi:hypothetical protein
MIVKNDFALVIRNAVSADMCKFLSTEFRMLENCVDFMNNATGKHTAPEIGLTESFSMYSPLFLETLSLHIKPLIEKAVGKTLWSTYSYGRIYKTGAELEPHLDRRSSEYTVSCCLDKDSEHDWSLIIQRLDGTTEEYFLEVGDILVYPGRDLTHWRNGKFKGHEQIQAFIQYVDQSGDSADLKWDGRPLMGLSWETAKSEVHQGLQQMMDTLKKAPTPAALDKVLLGIADLINPLLKP